MSVFDQIRILVDDICAFLFNDPSYAEIDFSTADTHSIIAAPGASKKLVIYKIMFTVGGDTNITFKDGATDITGAMDFGGTSEPRGVTDVNPLGRGLPLSENAAFQITSSGNVQVSGYVLYKTKAT